MMSATVPIAHNSGSVPMAHGSTQIAEQECEPLSLQDAITRARPLAIDRCSKWGQRTFSEDRQ